MKTAFRHIYYLLAVALTGCSPHMTRIAIENPSDFSRTEIVAYAMPPVTGPVRLLDSLGNEVAYQLSADSSQIFFEVSLAPGASAIYSLDNAEPTIRPDTTAYGRLFPERLDDFAWENDRAAYRAYGPALQAQGQQAYGYDVWTKSVAAPVIEKRYFNELNRHISYHVDHGDGMDVYAVGPTLGAGTAALVDSADNIHMPWAFARSEVLENGPLRFKFRLTYPPMEFEGDSIVEIRTITLDKGSYLNRTELEFRGLAHEARVAPGIVVHRQNPDAYVSDPEGSFITYTDLTENVDNGNGKIFIGVLVPGCDIFRYRPLNPEAGDAIGHIMAQSTITPDSRFVYYWGAAWNKGGVSDDAEWNRLMKQAAKAVATPLIVKSADDTRSE